MNRNCDFARCATFVVLVLGTLVGTASADPGNGACCLSDSCVSAPDETQCLQLGGFFLAGMDCADDPCGVGACCTETSCIETTAFNCLIGGRDFVGAGTLCADDPCGIAAGACCFDGICTIRDENDCATIGGTYLGTGTNCGNDPCSLGACCLTADCQDTARHECDILAGEFIPGGACASDPCPQVIECPEGSLFSQVPDAPETFIPAISSASAGEIRRDDFSNVAGATEGITWWGLEVSDPVDGFLPCKNGVIEAFDVTFFEASGSEPGDVACSFSGLAATRTPLGVVYDGVELIQYHADLPASCGLTRGWLSISAPADSPCLFMWMTAGPGRSQCDGCVGTEEEFDLSFCLEGTIGGVFGACCHDSNGFCLEDVEIIKCLAEDQRFRAGAMCAEFDPPCGELPGACCLVETPCEFTSEMNCENLGGTWLGAGADCNTCPCDTPCPPNATAEGEPPCEDGYVDEFNPGCSGAVPAFTSIAVGETVCGESGIFTIEELPVPDEDWYEVVLPSPADLTIRIEAEFEVAISIFDAGGGCPGSEVASGSTDSCTPVEISAPVDAGPYWLVVVPVLGGESLTCGARYTLTVVCPGDATGDGVVGFADVLAILGAWGPCTECPEDVNRDGEVGFADVLLVLGNWGPCSPKA